jgi:hypothetical protein
MHKRLQNYAGNGVCKPFYQRVAKMILGHLFTFILVSVANVSRSPKRADLLRLLRLQMGLTTVTRRVST